MVFDAWLSVFQTLPSSLSRNWSQFFIFHGLLLYTEMLCKSHAGSAVLTFIKVRCFIQMYTEVLGVLHHLLARGPADNLWPSPCDSGQSTRTLISPGVIILKTDTTHHWKRLWCWEGLGAGGEGDNRGWDGWMALLTLWTQVWVNSGSWWWTGRPGVLWFMGLQRVGHNWATELNWTECTIGP